MCPRSVQRRFLGCEYRTVPETTLYRLGTLSPATVSIYYTSLRVSLTLDAMPVFCTHCGNQFRLPAHLGRHLKDHSGNCKQWPIARQRAAPTTHRHVAARRPVQTAAVPAGDFDDDGTDGDEDATSAAELPVHDLNGILWRYCMTCNAGRGLNDTDRLGLLELVAQFH